MQGWNILATKLTQGKIDDLLVHLTCGWVVFINIPSLLTCIAFSLLLFFFFKSVDVNTEIVFEANPSNGESVTLCAFVVTDWRDGQWDVNLPADGFSVISGMTWYPTPTGAMRKYCKTLSVAAPTLSYTFPPVATSQFVHGLCVLGASKATVTSDDPQLTYTSIPNFGNDVQLWDNRGYKALGIDNEDYCKGGTYLRPSLHKVRLMIHSFI